MNHIRLYVAGLVTWIAFGLAGCSGSLPFGATPTPTPTATLTPISTPSPTSTATLVPTPASPYAELRTTVNVPTLFIVNLELNGTRMHSNGTVTGEMALTDIVPGTYDVNVEWLPGNGCNTVTIAANTDAALTGDWTMTWMPNASGQMVYQTSNVQLTLAAGDIVEIDFVALCQ
jgi:hypothetical protein